MLRFEIFFQFFFDLLECFGDVFALLLDLSDFLGRNLGNVEEFGLGFVEFFAELLAFFGADFLRFGLTWTPDERASLWPRVTATYKGYAGYQRKTDREIPLVILERR